MYKPLSDAEKEGSGTEKYLEIVGLTKYRKYYPKQLSASMLQRGEHRPSIRHGAGTAADG